MKTCLESIQGRDAEIKLENREEEKGRNSVEWKGISEEEGHFECH